MRDVEARSRASLEQPAPRPAAPVIVGAEGLLGLSVVDRDGERVGQLWDIVLDLRADRIAYGIVVLERMQRVERVIAVPWSALAFDIVCDCLCVDAPRDWVEQAPEMKPSALSRLLEPELVDLIHRHFAARPSWERAA